MKNLRFSGITKQHKTVALALNAIIIIIGISLFIAAFTAKIQGNLFTPSSDLPDGAKVVLFIGGIIFAAQGISNILSLKTLDKSYIEISDSKIAGAQYTAIIPFYPTEEKFSITYDRILDIQVANASFMTPTISIQTAEKQYRVSVADAEKAVSIISEKIS